MSAIHRAPPVIRTIFNLKGRPGFFAPFTRERPNDKPGTNVVTVDGY